MISEATVGTICALGAAMTWAVTSYLVRALLPALGAVGINALRSTAGGALLLAWLALAGGLGRLGALSGQTLLLLALSIVVAIAVGDTVFFESTRLVGLGPAMTISMSYPLATAVLAAAALDEPVTPGLAAGSVLTLAGLVLIVAPWTHAGRGPAYWRGVGAAGLAALAWAVSIVLVKVPLSEVDPLTAQAVRLPLAGLLLWLTPWSRGALRALPGAGRAVAGRLAALSVLTAGSSVMFVASVKYTDVAVAAVLSSTAPLFALPLGVALLGERLTVTALAGTVTTVAGIAVLQLWG